jgi:hypothetical protein
MEISGDYIEFRENSLLLDLIVDSGNAWITNTATYSIPAADMIQVTGSCFHGWERYACTQTYRLSIGTGQMSIFDETDSTRQGEYMYIGTPGPNLPPTLMPPGPSPTP